MNNTVTVAYPVGSDTQIEVHYAIELTDDIQTISCQIEGKIFPNWLQLRKFTMSSVHELGDYIPLFNELNNSKNMDTTLFIDMVYTSIMNTEHFNCRQL